jgi:hypothetical protein
MSEHTSAGRTNRTDRHAFISYVREDSGTVDWLQRKLEAADVRVWRDTADLWPGEDWRAKIRQAIRDDALVFIACFSQQSVARDRSFQNEELVLAIEELRCRPQGVPWLIPVRFSECDIPDLDIGAGRTLRSIQRADLFGDRADEGINRLITSIRRIQGRTVDAPVAAIPNDAETLRPQVAAEHRRDGPAGRQVLSHDALVLSDVLPQERIYRHHSHKSPLPERIRQYDTHSMLAAQTGPHGAPLAPLNLDAIIVPAARPPAHLDHAVTLARAAGCWLLVLCSQQLRSTEARKFLAARSFHRAIVIDLPSGYSHKLLYFPGLLSIKDELPEACGFYVTDLSMKRNIGLVLARMLGWRRVFFLDDDIRDITYPDLQRTVDMLGPFSTTGLSVTDFPENSIVSHANLMTAGSQDVFVSAAALAVDCDADIGFFPDIYNEDWLFFFDNASQGRLANSGLKATQLGYYPFANPRRAAWQEFGDVIAEGLYALLHLGLEVEDATGVYWAQFLEARRNFLEAIITRSQIAHPDMRDEMMLSVQGAQKCLLTIRPELCERYVRLWRQDLADWKRRAAAIPTMPSVEAALEEMQLAPPTLANGSGRTLPRRSEAAPDITAGPVAIPRFDTLKALSEHHSVLHLSSATLDAEKRDTKAFPVLTEEYSAAMLAARMNGRRQREQRLGTRVPRLTSAWPWRRGVAWR